jgi:hypothetical protein
MEFEGDRKFKARWFSRIASILLLALAMAGAGAAQVAPPVGPYGFVLNATFADSSTQGGAAILGLMNIDSAGNVSGPYQLELGSGGANAPQSISGSFTGTYSSNPVPPYPDGSGTISMALDVGVNLTLTTLIDNRGRTIQLALTGCTGPICDLTGTVVSGIAEIEFTGLPHPVHLGFLNGSYGLQTTKSSPIPATSIGTWTFDGLGNVTITDTFVGAGANVQGPETLSGSYSVNLDGTGVVTIPPQNHQWAFVISEGHSGLLVLQMHRAGDGVMYGSGRLQ